jgi:hypothetical protein
MKGFKLYVVAILLGFSPLCPAQTLVERTYVMRVETTIAEPIGGLVHTCMLVYPDRRFRKEKSYVDRSNANPPTQVYLDKLPEADMHALEAIISDKQFQLIQSLGPRAFVVHDMDMLFVSIPQEHSVQNFVFKNEEDRKPYKETLKPFIRFIGNLDRRKVQTAKDEPSNNCEAPRVMYRSMVSPSSAQ